ncbi:PQQ-like beta-propeller repeat protein [Aeoliella sp. ICT_H6.2]|uniref:PQQ-like beta-propeller repeat protein n=1 Tax=Aeoliella straminimaris TaxID=2954799 RepID=A0A9X2JIQ1_9BACT|nr:PQQ-binding-like beta-propeller repeat protein [Aeoliella straminimaris]MCO6044174.1 PQQ-like beta-propeller repeat protein [Aeoliella straminimaris]
MSRYLLGFVLFLVSLSAIASAEDWPQWLGPDSASEWNAPGIKTSFGEGDLNIKWRVPCGPGYSGPAVADGKVYLFDYEVTEGTIENNPGRPIALKGNERVHCIDAASGKVLWTKGMPVDYYVSYPSGPRATPCVDGDHVYTLGAEGDLVCRSTSDGEIVWQVNFLKKFGIKTPIWGHSSSPLVIGDLVYVLVGGEGTAIVAFDKNTGEEAWRALNSNEPGYSAPIAMDLNGKKCVVAFYPSGVAVLDAKNGAEQWSKPSQPKYGMSIAVPRKMGEKMFVTGYGEAMMIDGVGSGDPKIIWKSNSPREALYCSNAPPYFADDVIYGCDIESSHFMAIDPATGDRLWENREVLVGPDAGRGDRHGTGFLVRHTPSGKYFLFNERGELLVCDLSREQFEILAQDKIIEPDGEAFGRDVVWTHPAFAEGCVFARNNSEIVCVELTE